MIIRYTAKNKLMRTSGTTVVIPSLNGCENMK